MRKLYAVFGLLIVASMILAACQPTTVVQPKTVIQTVIVEGTPQIVVVTPEPVVGPKVLRVNLGPGDVPTIDPALSTDTSSVQIVDETTIGLGRQHEETNELEPGMATWTTVVNDDGTMTATYTLRTDVPWVKWDGTQVVQVMDCQETPAPRMVNAYDFEYGILRTLTPATASDYAYVLNFAIKGGSAYNAGETEDPTTVGVKAIDATTLEITFVDAAVYNLNIASMWVAHAQPKWLIEGDDCTEARGDRWTETGFFQGYGPFTMKEWVHDSYITIVKNPFWPGTDSVPASKIDEIRFSMLDEIAAFAEYEAGNLGISGVPSGDIDRVKADPVLSAELVIAPVQCTYYYGFNTSKPFVDDVRVRRALSMAIDRQALIDNVTKGNQQPAQWFARPGLAGAPTMADHPDTGVKFDAAAAKALLDEYLTEKGIAAADVDLTLMFNTSSGHQKIAEAIQQMWKQNLGLDVKLANQEWKVYLKTLQEDSPQIWRLGWCSDYPDANNFTKEVFATGGHEEAATKWNNATFDEILAKAALETDLTKRTDLYAQAEQILVYDDAAIAPIYFYTRNTVTKPYITRTFGVGGQEYFEKWDIAAH